MKLRNAVKLLATLLPAGVMGVSAALASTQPADTDLGIAKSEDVASRLASIRDAVSEVAKEEAAKEENIKTAWWANWPGGGVRFGGWGAGWGNGGWHNWGNGWRNWGNGWHNWGNWHNW